jgi:glutamate dehydrogenase/leucine dehydrogenase
MSLRYIHGDRFVHHVGLTTEAPDALFDVEADVLVPGARTGVITEEVANRLRSRWLVPAANVPYTAVALDVLRKRRIRYLPDFVCNAGATIGYMSDVQGPGELFQHVERTINRIMAEATADPRGSFEGACKMAERFIEGWRGADEMPDGPPLADTS